MIIGVVFFSCAEEDEKRVDEVTVQLESPAGFKIADNISGLYNNLNLNYNDEKIVKIEYIDSERMNAAIVYYSDINGDVKNTAIVKGEFSYKSSKVDFFQNQDDPIIVENGYALSCKGCECTINATYNPNTGVHTFQCSKTCCVLDVTVVPIGN